MRAFINKMYPQSQPTWSGFPIPEIAVGTNQSASDSEIPVGQNGYRVAVYD